MQPADVPRLGGIEQRHRDPAGVQGAEERAQVVQALRTQNGDAVTRLGHLLKPGAHRTVTGTELGPRNVPRYTITFGGVVQEPVGQLVSAHLRPLLDVTNQVGVVRKLDSPVLIDERVVVRHAMHSCQNCSRSAAVTADWADGYIRRGSA